MAFGELTLSNNNMSNTGLALVEETGEPDRGVAKGPERALMSALLFDGVVACLNYAGAQSRNARRRFQEAFSWINTPGDEYIFSFDNVCQCLGLNPEALRVGITRNCNVTAERARKARRTF